MKRNMYLSYNISMLNNSKSANDCEYINNINISTEIYHANIDLPSCVLYYENGKKVRFLG